VRERVQESVSLKNIRMKDNTIVWRAESPDYDNEHRESDHSYLDIHQSYDTQSHKVQTVRADDGLKGVYVNYSDDHSIRAIVSENNKLCVLDMIIYDKLQTRTIPFPFKGACKVMLSANNNALMILGKQKIYVCTLNRVSTSLTSYMTRTKSKTDRNPIDYFQDVFVQCVNKPPSRVD
jgi:hypothetical protein